eukprot:COSAG04_NODE_4573_length_2008_cov_8.534835_5_plen_59_part_01
MQPLRHLLANRAAHIACEVALRSLGSSMRRPDEPKHQVSRVRNPHTRRNPADASDARAQ